MSRGLTRKTITAIDFFGDVCYNESRKRKNVGILQVAPLNPLQDKEEKI